MKVHSAVTFAVIAAAWFTGTASIAAPAQHYRIVEKIPLSGPVRWSELYVDSARHRLFIARSSFVSVIDTATDTEIGRIPGTQSMHAIAVLDKLGLGFTTDGGSDRVIVFNLKTLAVKTAIPVHKYPDGIVADPSTNRVICMNAKSDDLSIIDGGSLSVLATVKLNGRPEDYETDDAGHVFTHYKGTTEVAEVDESTAKILKEWPLAPASDPDGMALYRKLGLLFSACDNNLLAVSSVVKSKLVATVAIGAGPDQLAIDQSSETVFVPCGDDGIIDVVERNAGGRYAVVDHAQSQFGARTIAYDPLTKTLYTCTAAPAPHSTSADDDSDGDRKAHWLVNSFVVLVLKSRK